MILAVRANSSASCGGSGSIGCHPGPAPGARVVSFTRGTVPARGAVLSRFSLVSPFSSRELVQRACRRVSAAAGADEFYENRSGLPDRAAGTSLDPGCSGAAVRRSTTTSSISTTTQPRRMPNHPVVHDGLWVRITVGVSASMTATAPDGRIHTPYRKLSAGWTGYRELLIAAH